MAARGPKFVRYFGPVLDALRALGSSAQPSEVINWISQNCDVPKDESERISKSGHSVFENRVHWARFYLVKAGFIDNTVRGLWVLTSNGQNKRLDQEAAVLTFKSVHEKFVEERRQRGESADAELDGDESAPSGPSEKQDFINANEIRARLIARLQSLSDVGFEHFCAFVLRHIGFTNVSVTQRSHDRGIDGEGYLLINRFVRTKVMFQCKRYQGSVGSDRVQAFRGAIHGRAERGIIVTTGAFTRAAMDEAARENATPMELVDIDRLLDLLIEERLGVIEKKALVIDDDFFAPFADAQSID